MNSFVSANPYESINVFTDTWSPFVLPKDKGFGPAQSSVRLIFNEADYDPDFVYLDYFQVFKLVEEDRIQAAFPYFKTPAREDKVLYSASLGETENYLYFDVYHFDEQTPDIESNDLKYGRVIGYSYGENIESILN